MKRGRPRREAILQPYTDPIDPEFDDLGPQVEYVGDIHFTLSPGKVDPLEPDDIRTIKGMTGKNDD